MPKSLSYLIQGFLTIVLSLLNAVWKIFFKAILVPLYKFFLFTKKYFNNYLIKNPKLPLAQATSSFKQRTVFHIIIIIIVLFVLINNFATHKTYAEEFNKKSIIAQLFITDIEKEIIEKAPSIEAIKQAPKTESVLNQLSALEAKKNIIAIQEESQLAMSQGGEVLIKPNITPFAEDEGSSVETAPSSSEIRYYVVQPGDTLSAIAKKFGVSINTILWENNLSLTSYIRPGDKLAILPVTGVTYTVSSGDTLSRIANKFGTTVEKIAAFNNLGSDSILRVRQKIIIPDGKLGYSSLTPTHSIFSGTPSAKNFLWPSDYKKITQYYHWRHHAIDIGAKYGSPIYACRAGRVERAGWSRGYGYNIVINHGGGVKTLYAHASKLYVKHGDQVKQGQVIGAVGSTGWSTGAHLHLEIIINGKKVNPLSYL